MDKSAIERIQEAGALAIAREQLDKQKLPGVYVAPENLDRS